MGSWVLVLGNNSKELISRLKVSNKLLISRVILSVIERTYLEVDSLLRGWFKIRCDLHSRHQDTRKVFYLKNN